MKPVLGVADKRLPPIAAALDWSGGCGALAGGGSQCAKEKISALCP